MDSKTLKQDNYNYNDNRIQEGYGKNQRSGNILKGGKNRSNIKTDC